MKIVAELIVFLVKEGRVAPAGERGSPTLCSVWSVGKRWQLTLENLAEMLSLEAKNILISIMPKMRKILSSGYTLNIITRGERMSPSA